MLYLLDANVLIDANRDYYPLDRVPEFWEWLEHQGRAGAAAVCREISAELVDDMAGSPRSNQARARPLPPLPAPATRPTCAHPVPFPPPSVSFLPPA